MISIVIYWEKEMEYIYQLRFKGSVFGEKIICITEEDGGLCYKTELCQGGDRIAFDVKMDEDYYVRSVEYLIKNQLSEKKYIFNEKNNIIINNKYYFDDILIFMLPKIYKKDIINYFVLSSNKMEFVFMKVLQKDENRYNIILPEYSYMRYDEGILCYYEDFNKELVINRV